MALPNLSLKRTRREASLVYAGIPAARRLASPLGILEMCQTNGGIAMSSRLILLLAAVGIWGCASE
jgi:hypothetical protein